MWEGSQTRKKMLDIVWEATTKFCEQSYIQIHCIDDGEEEGKKAQVSFC